MADHEERRLKRPHSTLIKAGLTSSICDIPYRLCVNGDSADADWPEEAFSSAVIPRTAEIMNDLVRMGCTRAVAALVADGVPVPPLTCHLVAHIGEMISQGWTTWMLATLRLHCSPVTDGKFPYPCGGVGVRAVARTWCSCTTIVCHYYSVNKLVRDFFDTEMNMSVFPVTLGEMHWFIENIDVKLILDVLGDNLRKHNHLRELFKQDIVNRSALMAKVLGKLVHYPSEADGIMKLLHRLPGDFMKYTCSLTPDEDPDHEGCSCNCNYLLFIAANNRQRSFFIWLLNRGVFVRHGPTDIFECAIRHLYERFDDSYIKVLLRSGYVMHEHKLYLYCIGHTGFMNLDIFGRALKKAMQNPSQHLIDLVSNMCFDGRPSYHETTARRKDLALRIPGGFKFLTIICAKMIDEQGMRRDEKKHQCAMELAYYQRIILEPIIWLQACQKRAQPANTRFPREILRKISQFLLHM